MPPLFGVEPFDWETYHYEFSWFEEIVAGGEPSMYRLTVQRYQSNGQDHPELYTTITIQGIMAHMFFENRHYREELVESVKRMIKLMPGQ